MQGESLYTAHGKLLLTGEYAVMDGALALALPTQLGQRMSVRPTDKKEVFFRSLTSEGKVWFEQVLFQGIQHPIAQPLEQLLQEAQRLNPSFLSEQGAWVETQLEFPQYWGLGSSSTLVTMIAQWAGVDPYQLLKASFGGSGYDIACAEANSPILYHLQEGAPRSYPIYYKPTFASQLFFVYLNQKQNSREGIALYRAIKKKKEALIQQITTLTEYIYRTTTIDEFCLLIEAHEALLATYLQLPTVKERLFKDFQGTLKSLGAWGGDFILAIAEAPYVQAYFTSRGFNTIIPFDQMVLITDREPVLPPSH